MRIVEFNVDVDSGQRTITLPDDPNDFTSMYYDKTTGTMQAVYLGTDPLENIPGSEIPKWDRDTQDWINFNARRYVLTKKEFSLLFTPAEYRSFMNAAETDDVVFQFWNVLQVADWVDLKDPITVNGMEYVVQKGLLTDQRRDEIMWGLPENP